MPSGEVVVMLHGAGEPREIILKNMFPFMTLQDIKTAVYIHLEKDVNAIPEFTYLCAHGPKPGGDPYLGKKTIPVDYTWNDPRLEAKNFFYNQSPTVLASSSLDNRFVEQNGERRLISVVNRERVTIEDAFFKIGICGAKVIPEFHMYLYNELLGAIPGPKPPSEKDWNGRLYPFFPYLSAGTTGPTKEQTERAERMAVVFSRRQKFLAKLQSLLDDNVPLDNELSLGSVKYLQLTWSKKRSIAGIEAPFYEAPVTERRPFMRLLPVEGSGISKIYLADGKTPDIQDPKLLIAWSQERNPTPEQDFAFAKVLVRKRYMNVAPVYGTVRLFNDGTVDFIVEPPKGVKKMDPRTDLPQFGESIVEGLKDLPYIDSMPDIKKAMLVLVMKQERDSKPITSRILRERLPIFTSFFQEIAALPGERPLLMLRYKLVSNFATQDRVQTFITQVMNRKVLRGEGIATNMTELVADEFQFDMAEARKQVGTFFESQGSVAVVNPESKDYMMQNNPGIDIAIFSQHPFYTFHLYNINSLENLQRIITALSMMLSASVQSLTVEKKDVKDLQKAEGVIELEDEGEEIAADADTETETPLESVMPIEDTDMPEEYDDYLDMFAYEQGEGMTQDEAQAAQIVAAQEGTPYPESPTRDATPAPVRPDPNAVPVEELKRDIVESSFIPKEDLQGLRIAPAVGVPAVAPVAAPVPVADNSGDESDTQTGNTKGLSKFFIEKLKEADRRLFDYTKTNPSLKRYVSKCQPTHGRQPAVLSQALFEQMEQEYRGEVFFQIFPLEPGESDKAPGVIEKDYFSVLRYGTSRENQNYYICCRYFCTKDEIMIREADLESTVMRRPKGAPKRPGECPFCKGKIISSRRHPRPGETILEREVKPKTDSRHLYIRFLKPPTPHPDGFYLPCCFLDESPIKYTDAAFDKYREWGEGPKSKTRVLAASAALDSDDEQEELEAPKQESGLPIIDYYVMLTGVTKKYIIGGEKMPLEVNTLTGKGQGEAQVGLLPPVLDTYFNQDPTQLVSRTFNPQKIREGGTGFLRIGVENRNRFQADSFLAAIAPYYSLNTAGQMKTLLLDKITPRVYLSLNYGNMVLEFYDPADSIVKRPTDSVLAEWVSKELDVDVDESNKEALVRLYMSYFSFQEWLKSTKTKKEFRHFGLALSQSNLIRRTAFGPGTTFIVLDILKNGKMSVRCPPYGFNAEIMAQNNVAFIMHHWSGIWEPIFFVDNRTVEQRGVDIFTLTFQMNNASQWPSIVTKRLQEYMNQCSSNGRAAYTSHSKINSMSIIPASICDSIFRKELLLQTVGIVRDAYNHLGALVYKDKAHSGHIALPVVDDGQLFVSKRMFLDWDDPAMKPAPINQVIRFYKKFVEPRFSLYKGYSPLRVVKGRKSGNIEALQLRNGLYIPANPPTDDIEEVEKMPYVTVDVMEWKRNHEICLEEKTVEIPGEKARMEQIEFQEVFEHLRLTFSNWLAAKEDGGEFREVLKDVIFSYKLPLYERRKRLEILLRKEIESWITTDFTDEDAKRSHETSLLRVDCRVKNKESCGGRCVWRGEEEKCMLHVPDETHLGEEEKVVSAPTVLLARLIEELLRYAERRRQLLEQDVSRLATLENPVTINGNQRIFPEKSAAWYELLRLDWAVTKDEVPKFYEEMSRAPVAPPLAKQDESNKLPPTLENVLNGGEPDPKTGALRLKRGTFEQLLGRLGLTPGQLSIEADTKALTEKMLRFIVNEKSMGVIQIDIRADPPVHSAYKQVRPSAPDVPVFIITEEGPAFLLLSPEQPELLTQKDMPKGLAEIYSKAHELIRFRKP